jgi:hypothetical protein
MTGIDSAASAHKKPGDRNCILAKIVVLLIRFYLCYYEDNNVKQLVNEHPSRIKVYPITIAI